MRIQAIPLLCASVLLSAGTLYASSERALGNGQAIITVESKDENKPAPLDPGTLRLRIDGKAATVTGLQSLDSPATPVELVVLIDNGLRSSIGNQLSEITAFVREIPSQTRVAIAYMENGRAVFASPLTADAKVAEKGIRLPGGMPGSSASPYFCLSDLAKNWPSSDVNARRIVVMISDGIDPYNPRFDPDDSYMQRSIQDLIHAGIQVNSFVWADSRNRSFSQDGQSLLIMVSDATGGKVYGEGFNSPVSFQPFFSALRKELRNQYRIRFTAPLGSKAEILRMELKTSGTSAKLVAPQQVLVTPGAAALKE
jgi:hypothetical protein